MTESRWIGLSGKMGAGKDHTYRAMWGQPLRRGIFRVSFADILRCEIEDVLGAEELPALWSKPYSKEVRRLLQWWGTDLRRAEDEDYWVKQALISVKDGVALGSVPVFTDVRFPNEADAIKEHGGILVRVEAPDDVRRARLGVEELPNHESETALDDYPNFDFVLDSSGIDPSGYVANVRLILIFAGLTGVEG